MRVETVAIVDQLSSPAIASLLSIHPNDLTLSGRQVPSHWSPWWAWASDYPLARPGHSPAWLGLMRYFTRSCEDGEPNVDIPPELCSLADSVRNMQLQRTPTAYETFITGDRAYRISPKKEHEVDRMSSYVRHLVHSQSPRSVWHAVDVGSGQGYLSRALQELDFHVLALDNNAHQTSGANRWTTKEVARKLKRERRTAHLKGTLEPAQNVDSSSRPGSEQANTALRRCGDAQRTGTRRGSLTHHTVHVSPQTLEESIAGWLADHPGIAKPGDADVHRLSPCPDPVPVMLVALHACGSLTVDVLRTFLSDQAKAPQGHDVKRAWRPHSLVVVGCCYNLMSPSDFPLSKPLRDMDPVPRLTTAAVHLASQVPSQWLKNQDAMRNAELALRKVVYRALLQPLLQAAATRSNASSDHATPPERPIQPGLGETPTNRRLGKLSDTAYQDWPTFLAHATNKLGIDLAVVRSSLPDWFTHEAVRLKMESGLYVLQTLRCILGPLIETLILLDRRDWIRHELAEMNYGGPEVEVEVVNLFDQASGSGRNVALVIKPATIPQSVLSDDRTRLGTQGFHITS